MIENEDFKESIFEKLKNIRIKKNIELKSISEKTKINIKYLEAIESGKIKEIPEVYDKLFFQTYLTSLNIKKKDEYLDEFYKIRKEVRPQYTTTIQKIKSIKSDSRRFSKLKQIYLIVPILIVIILIVFFAMNSKLIEENAVDDVPELSVREIANEIEQKSIEETESDIYTTEKSKSKTSSGVNVSLSTIELTWLRLVRDNSDTSEYLLQPGNILSEQADSVMIFLIGNAGGVLFNVNGVDVGKLGSSSEIVTNLKITNEGIISKNLKVMPKEGKVDSLTNN